MNAKTLFIANLIGMAAMLAGCGGGGSVVVEPVKQPTPLIEEPNNPAPAPSPIPNVPPTALCEGQNGAIDVPRAPGVSTGRALAVNDLSTLKGEYCNNSTGRYEIRNGVPAPVVAEYSSCSLKVEEGGRFTLKAGDKTFTALVDGSARDRAVGGAASVLDPSLEAVYSVSAVDETSTGPTERVDVLVHRGRIVQASGERPNLALGLLNKEKLNCNFLNPTQVGSSAQTGLVGRNATASDLASSLVTQVQGTVTGIVQGQVAGRVCSITIDNAGSITIVAPELNNAAEFTGVNITTTAKLDGDASDFTTLQNGKVRIDVVSGNQQLFLQVNQSTQQIESGLGGGGGGLCQATQ